MCNILKYVRGMAVMSFVKKDSPPSGAGVPLAPVLAAQLVAVPFFQLVIRNRRESRSTDS